MLTTPSEFLTFLKHELVQAHYEQRTIQLRMLDMSKKYFEITRPKFVFSLFDLQERDFIHEAMLKT